MATSIQSYSRINDEKSKENGLLDVSKLVAHKNKLSHNEMFVLIRGAIEKANRKSSRESISIPDNAASEELQTTFVKNDKTALSFVTCKVICDDSREVLKGYVGQVDLIVTSPPYADARHRHYDSVHPDRYKDWFLTFHQAFFDALKPTGSLVINIKDRVVDGVRHRYVWQTMEALCEKGWFAIDDYLWHKPNPMPGYWPSRLSDGWEYCFHLAKQKKPFFNHEGVKKPIGEWAETRLTNLGENDLNRHNSVNKSGFGRDLSRWVGKERVLPSNVISAAVVGKNKKHPAVFPVDLPEFFIKLLCPENGLVVDPFGGSGSTGVAALSLERDCVLIDNQENYCQVAQQRLKDEAGAKLLDLNGNSISNNGYSFKTESSPQMQLLENPAPFEVEETS